MGEIKSVKGTLVVFSVLYSCLTAAAVSLTDRKLNCEGYFANDGLVYPNIVEAILQPGLGTPIQEIVRQFEYEWINWPTQPLEGVNSRFKFVLHSVLDERELKIQIGRQWRHETLSPAELKEKIRFGLAERMRRGSYRLEHPETFSEKEALSVSIVDEKHSQTFGNSGVILRVPFSNVYATAPSDMGGRIGSHAGLLDRSEALGISKPEDVIAEMSVYHNEVAIAGTSRTGEKIEVVGFYAKFISRDQPAVSESRILDLMRISRSKRLPLVHIVDPEALRDRSY